MSKIISRPGPRFVYPDLVNSPSLARCGLVANALWPRLICQADDQGRMQGDAGSVLVSCFPKLLSTVTHADVEAALDELKSARMIFVYRANGETYLQISGWWRWQQGMRRAYASRFPSYRGWIDITYGYEGQPTSFGNALEVRGFVLESDGRVRARRPQSAGRVRAVRPQSAGSNARAQGHDPTHPDPSRPDPTHPDPYSAREPAPRTTTGRSRSPGEPTPREPDARPRQVDQRAIEENVSIAGDPTRPEPVRRAARAALARHAPDRLAELEAAAP